MSMVLSMVKDKIKVVGMHTSTECPSLSQSDVVSLCPNIDIFCVQCMIGNNRYELRRKTPVYGV